MKERQPLEQVGEMAKSYGDQLADMLKACTGCGNPGHACSCPRVERVKAAPVKAPGMLAKAMDGLRELLAKSQVKGYTKKDGTVVAPHSTKVQAHPDAPKLGPKGKKFLEDHLTAQALHKQALGDKAQHFQSHFDAMDKVAHEHAASLDDDAQPSLPGLDSPEEAAHFAAKGVKPGAGPKAAKAKKVSWKSHPIDAHMDDMLAEGKREFADSEDDQQKLAAIADSIKEGNLAAAKASLNSADTVIREFVFQFIHPEWLQHVGMSALRPDEAHAKFASKFGGKTAKKATDPEWSKGADAKKAAQGPGAKPAPTSAGKDGDVSREAAGGSLKDHPNFNAEDHAELKGKGYSDDEIRAIWDKDTERNGGQPTGGTPRKDVAQAKEAGDVLSKVGKTLAEGPDADPGEVPDHHYDQMESDLANDENSSDEELVEHWKGAGIHPKHAEAAVKHRDAFLTDPLPEKGKLKGLMGKKPKAGGGMAKGGLAISADLMARIRGQK